MKQIDLRDYQVDAVEQLRSGIRAGHRSQILCAPTGAGKTTIAAYLMQASASKGMKCAFVVDRVALVDQTSAVLDAYGIDHGVIQAGHWRRRMYEPIQVCSAQTLEKRGFFPELRALYVDEAHCQRSATTQLIKNYPELVVIGLTATPLTKGLSESYSRVVNVTTVNRLIADGWLVPLVSYAAVTPDMTGAKVVAGEWSPDDIEKRGNAIVGDIVGEWQAKTLQHFGRPVKTLVFSATVAHGEEICRQFAAAGHDFRQLSYKDGTDDERREIIAEFRKPDSTIRGLVSCEVLTKGFDVPDVLCLAEGSKVLTQRGLISIEKVLLSDRIWDGFEFVEHGGPIFKGEQDVIEYAGLTATAEHKVKTAQGWRTFGQCAREQIPIVATGFGGAPVRESEGYFSRGDVAWREMEAEAAHPSRLRDVRQGIKRFARLATWLPSAGLFGLQKIGTTFAVVSGAREVAESTMRGSIAQGISELWRAWCGVPVPVSAGWCGMGSRQSRNTEAGSKHPTGSEKQRRPLRAGQPSVGIENAQRLQHATRRMDGEGAQIQAGSPGNQVCGQDSAQSNFSGVDGQANHGAVQPSIGQAKRRVWDILNAGPRNCFTCEGLLVHNCGISARPYRKSLSSHIQQLGRVIRPADGKTFALWLCVARGSRVLTNRGLVPINKVSLSDKIWDGTNFVTHGAPSAMASRKSLLTKGSQQPLGISSTRRRVGAPLGNAPVNKSPSHRPDLVNKRFGSVKIISPDVFWLGAKSRRFIHVVCECVTCGYRSVISLSNLEGARTKGCRSCNQPAPEYPQWLYARVQAMRSRCRNPNDANYPRYGALGVEFRFEGVKSGTLWIMTNLGVPKSPELMQLDRINPEAHYEPGNLRWLTVAHNQLNKRGNQAVARMHKFRLENPEILYSDSTLKRLLWSGMTDAQIIKRFHQPSSKPKGKYGTFSTPDPEIASLVRDF